MAGTGQLNRKQRRGRVGISSEQEAEAKLRLRGSPRVPGIVPSEPWIDACFGYLTDRAPDGSLIEYRTFREENFPPGGEETAMVRCALCGRMTPPNSIEKWTVIRTTMIDPAKVRAHRIRMGLSVLELIARIGLDGLAEYDAILKRQENATELTRSEFAEALECEPKDLTTKQTIKFKGCMDHKSRVLHNAHGASPSATAIATLQYRNLRLDLLKLPSEHTSDLKREIRRYHQTGVVRGN